MRSQTNTCFIYGLCDPRDGSIRYIGMTSDLTRRMREHFTRKKHMKGWVSNWIGSLKKIGLIPRVLVLETVDSSLWRDSERWWIAFGRKQNWPLTNLESGGLGDHTRVFTPEHIRNISTARKGMRFSEEHKRNLSLAYHARLARGLPYPRTGKKFSEEEKRHRVHLRRSEAAKLRWKKRKEKNHESNNL